MSPLPLLDVVSLSADSGRLRTEVRKFLDGELAACRFVGTCDSWLSGWDESFSGRLAERGWVGMTIPRQYGGHGRSALERHIVIEELLAAGAPVAAHWVADRQTAPSLLRYGSEFQRQQFLPQIALGRCSFAIGMSEPDSGSDLASVRTRAERVSGGWRLSGTKVWTSGAHRAQWFFVLARNEPMVSNRHAGLTQFIVDLRGDGVEVRPIPLLTGAHDFNEVVLNGAFVPDDHVLGEVGNGWHQVTSELGFERSGPERFLSTFPLLSSLVQHVAERDSRRGSATEEIGALVARLMSLRQMSISVAEALATGNEAGTQAALVKDLGTRFEQEVVERARLIADIEADQDAPAGTLAYHLARSMLHSPGFTLRGGTNEVLRGVVAKALEHT
jgi:acyl-CoA dehydrogenase